MTMTISTKRTPKPVDDEVKKTEKSAEKKKPSRTFSTKLPSGERAFTIEEGNDIMIVTQDVADLLTDRPTPEEFMTAVRNPTNPRQLRLMLESMREEAEEDMRELKLEREARARKLAQSKNPFYFITKFFKRSPRQ